MARRATWYESRNHYDGHRRKPGKSWKRSRHRYARRYVRDRWRRDLRRQEVTRDA